MPKWQKLGRIYNPERSGRHAKLLTHAANPLPIHLGGDIYRIFYNGRDSFQRSSIGAVDIDLVGRQIVNDHFLPFFEHGDPGTYYADGVSIGSAYTSNDKRYIFFMGWQAPKDGHWRGDLGRILVGEDFGLSLDGDKNRPFMGADEQDPISLSYPWILKFESGLFRMWYGSTITWTAQNGEMVHVLKSSSSYDGDHWQKEGISVPYIIGRAQAFSRPTVVKSGNNHYEMWFSYRGGPGSSYRIGYARSENALKWSLDLEGSGIDVSDLGWDSDMIEYPYVFDHGSDRYLLYCGNGYGRSGFGLALGV